MAAPAKFLFDMDFSAPDKSRERPATPAEIAQKIAAAEARAYRDGYDAAQREAKVESDRRAALALEEISIAIQGIATRFSGIETRMETEAVDVAVAVARKLCSELIAGEPLVEITGLVSDCFSHLVSTPHLVVRINEQLYEQARERIEKLAKQSGFEGRLVILAEPEIATGDCRIEWADGGVVLERAAIETHRRSMTWLITRTNRPRASQPIWRRCSTYRCRFRRYSGAPRWISASCSSSGPAPCWSSIVVSAKPSISMSTTGWWRAAKLCWWKTSLA